MNKKYLIDKLCLEPHPTEGGYFRRTYESDTATNINGKERKLLTTIYYMLTDDSPHGYMHNNASDIIHFHHGGSSIRYWVITQEGELSEHILGQNIAAGESPQLIVKGGDWKISNLIGGEYGLIGEAVAPGFEYSDNKIITKALAQEKFPLLIDKIRDFIKH